MSCHVISLKGARPQNEDTHQIILNLDGKDTTIKDINFYLINDGHGGKTVSEYLKDNLPKFFVDKRVQYPIPKKYVINVSDHIQKTLKEQSFSNNQGSTSLAVIHFKYNGENYLNVINTGDSRCILCRDTFAIPLTTDHKPYWPTELHRINQLGGKIVFDGFDWRIKDLSVSRAYGDVSATPFLTHRPDLFRYKLDKNDKFMIISCDGATDTLANHELVNYVLLNCYDSSLKTRINQNVNIAKKLAEHAIKKGSTDNVSIIVVFFD